MYSLDPEESEDRTQPPRVGGSATRGSSITDPPTVVSPNPSGASTHVSDPSPYRGVGDRAGSGAEQDLMPKPGVRVGNYELGPPIGVGGMATVYVAQDLSLERTVALKILPPRSAQDSEVLQRFLLEGKAAARLDHPNIARIFALGHDGSFYFLAFEFVEGRTVRQWIDDVGKIDLGLVLDWSTQTAMALAHADRRGVVHRDIKPSNLIVTPGGQIKLVDLGLARRYESQGQVDLTQSGTTLGTFDYISPEQARDPRNVDIRSDLYSLGCTMYHMLTGTPPFPGQNVVQKLLQHQEKAAPDIRAANPGVPDSVADLVARLMAKSPSDRPTSAESCVRELEAIRGEIAARAAETMPDVRPNTLSGFLSWLVPATVLTVVITFGAWLASDWGNAAPDSQANRSPSARDRIPPEDVAQVNPEPLVPKAIVADAALRKSPTTYRVKDGASLALALKESTPGSVIVLSEATRYELRPGEIPILERTDLTVKGESGVRPTIVATIPGPDELAATPTVAGLFRVRESRVTFQNVTFDLSAATGAWLDSAIHTENCDLTLRDVLFLSDSTTNKTAGRFVRFGKGDFRENSAWRPLRVENCRFLGNRAAISGRGALDISIYDSAMLGSEPLVDIEESDRETPWPCIIRIEHSNFQATAWTPVLELGNAAASIRVRNSVFAPKPGVQMILVNSRKPSRVDWFGRENLYGDFASFLESPRIEEEIVDFAQWSETGQTVREQSSMATKRFVYWPVESIALATNGRWADAFAMNPGPWSDVPVGVRSWATAAGTARPAATVNEVAVVSIDSGESGRTVRAETSGTSAAKPEPPLRTGATITASVPPDFNNASDTEPMPMPMPMQTNPEVEIPGGVRTKSGGNPATVSPIVENGNTASGTQPKESLVARPTDTGRQPGEIRPRPNASTDRTEPDAVPAEPGLPPVIRTTEEFRKALAEPGKPQGSTLTLAAGAVIRLDSPLTLGEGRWLIVAESGPARPRIVFTSQNRALVENKARWTIDKSANLRLRGIDIDWEANEPIGERLFDIAIGTQVVFESCNLTSTLARTDLFFFAASQSTVDDDFADNSNSRSSVRLIDSILRSAGGVFRCPGELRGEIELTGSLAVIGRPLVTILAPERLQPSQSFRVQLSQSTLALGASLAIVNLGRTPIERPNVEFQVRRTVLAGNDQTDGSLIVVQGGDPEDEVSDCVSWDGDEVAYHQWSTYRTDRNNISGMLSRRQSREEWQLSHTLQDHEPIHGDVDFSGGNFWGKNAEPWKAVPADFVIREGSPAAALGARIDRLPRIAATRPGAVSSTSFDRFEP